MKISSWMLWHWSWMLWHSARWMLRHSSFDFLSSHWTWIYSWASWKKAYMTQWATVFLYRVNSSWHMIAYSYWKVFHQLHAAGSVPVHVLGGKCFFQHARLNFGVLLLVWCVALGFGVRSGRSRPVLMDLAGAWWCLFSLILNRLEWTLTIFGAVALHVIMASFGCGSGLHEEHTLRAWTCEHAEHAFSTRCFGLSDSWPVRNLLNFFDVFFLCVKGSKAGRKMHNSKENMFTPRRVW